MPKHDEQSRLTVPNDMRYIPVIQAYVGEVAGKMGFEPEEVKYIVLGVEEAATNLIKYGFKPGETTVFDIICRHVALGIKVIIKDKGIPFDPAKISTYHANQLGQESDAAGLGTFLMYKAMDEVSYHNLGRRGKELHLVKYLKKQHIEELFPAIEMKPAETPPAGHVHEDIPVSIRLMQPDDAAGISKCVYDAYDYSYVYEHIYYPERVIELNEHGRMTSAVAVVPEKQIVGHCALFGASEESAVGELGMAVVDRRYRGLSIAGRMFNFLIEEAVHKGLTGVYAHAVTNHPYTQKMCEHGGMFPCGVLIGFAPSSLSFKGISNKLSQRETTVLTYRYLKQPIRARLFAPARHADMIRKLYDKIGFQPDFASAETSSVGNGRSAIQVTRLNSLGVAYIVISCYGKSTVSEVSTKLRHLISQNVKAVELFLDLKDPATSVLSDLFEDLGFFFAGILPGEYFSNALVLQYVNQMPIDYSKIQIYSDFAGELMDYVKQCDSNKSETGVVSSK